MQEGDFIYLRMEGGRQVRVPLKSLSEADQKVVPTLIPLATPETIKRSAAESAAIIDQHLAANYAKFGVKPNAKLRDSEFCRRAYLAIGGRIPTYDELTTFIRSSEKDKRYRLIDQLLESEAFVSNFYNFWADTLRVKAEMVEYLNGAPYIDWIKRSIRENKPYDMFVYEMITATGKLWENPATGYLLRDHGMPLDNLSYTSSVFLGTDISCAQCHDHPFEDWTQKDFYHLASFFGATDTMKGGAPEGRILQEIASKPELQDNGFRDQVRDLVRAHNYNVHDTITNVLSLPFDYKYEDGKPGDRVQPQVLFGDDPVLEEGKTSQRVAVGRWMTDRDNPRFAKVIANRLWDYVFGEPQLKPLDNIPDTAKAENPELMKFLETEMKRVDFNLREYLRILFYSDLFQREAPVESHDPSKTYHFAGPTLRRMSAEQIWDSFVSMCVPNPEEQKDLSVEFYIKYVDMDINKVSGEEVYQRVKTMRAVGQGEEMGLGAAMSDEADSKGNITFKGMKLRRASELRQPEAPSHILRIFGQSDRTLIHGASKQGSIPQLLALMNGAATEMIGSPESSLYRRLQEFNADKDKVDVIFLSVLSRYPTSDERQLAYRQIKAYGEMGFANVMWALVNTKEFLFIQ